MAKGNNNLNNAKNAKNDEFYTHLSDIELEMKYYKNFFKGKVVYCNCDDARESNFFKYFSMNFEYLGLKKLITTGYKKNGKGVVLVYEGDKNGNRNVDDEEIVVKELEGDGDFQSEECIEFLKEADVVVTNPPFSLFSEYVKQLMDYGKKFIIIGNMNAAAKKDIFPLIKENRMWLGQNMKGGTRKGNSLCFINKNKEIQEVSSWWYTNIENKRHTEPLVLYKKFNPTDNCSYENYEGIEVGASSDIPKDYDGIIGVPISFLMFHCGSQFEIVGKAEPAIELEKYKLSSFFKGEVKSRQIMFNGKKCQKTYHRIFIRRK